MVQSTGVLYLQMNKIHVPFRMLCSISSHPSTFGIYELFHSAHKKKYKAHLCVEKWTKQLSTWDAPEMVSMCINHRVYSWVPSLVTISLESYRCLGLCLPYLPPVYSQDCWTVPAIGLVTAGVVSGAAEHARWYRMCWLNVTILRRIWLLLFRSK